MHDLEAALGSAASGRESSWRAAVLAALVVLDEATDEEYANATKPDSLLNWPGPMMTAPISPPSGNAWPGC